MKSIIDNSNSCYICGKTADLEVHHCIFGTGKRKKADEDGLTVKLCHTCHQAIHSPTNNFDRTIQESLKKVAQRRWEDKYGSRADFVKRYGRNYL